MSNDNVNGEMAPIELDAHVDNDWLLKPCFTQMIEKEFPELFQARKKFEGYLEQSLKNIESKYPTVEGNGISINPEESAQFDHWLRMNPEYAEMPKEESEARFKQWLEKRKFNMERSIEIMQYKAYSNFKFT